MVSIRGGTMLDQMYTYTGLFLIVIVAGRYRPQRLRLYIPLVNRIGVKRLGQRSWQLITLYVRPRDIVMLGPRLAILPTKTLLRLLRYSHAKCRRTNKPKRLQWPAIHHDDHSILRYNSTVTLYRKMPLKTISRLWGQVNQFHLPLWLRKPVLQLYIWAFDCKLEEAAIEDLKQYNNLGEFFRRKLKADARPINQKHCVTSPADGKVLHYGKVENGKLEQVKGVTYSLRGFLGPTTWAPGVCEDVADHQRALTDRDYHGQIKLKPGHSLHHCIIYLAPGDYHRFHSPVSWSMAFRRHFPGELLSVNPGVARWVQGLFNFNERAVYFGQWMHGFFSMAAVGATNVGSIRIYSDKDLCTNTKDKHPHGTYFDKEFNDPIKVKKGELFGEFNLGSTIVLIFEAPDHFNFGLETGQKIRCGEPLGNCSLENEN